MLHKVQPTYNLFTEAFTYRAAARVCLLLAVISITTECFPVSPDSPAGTVNSWCRTAQTNPDTSMWWTGNSTVLTNKLESVRTASKEASNAARQLADSIAKVWNIADIDTYVLGTSSALNTPQGSNFTAVYHVMNLTPQSVWILFQDVLLLHAGGIARLFHLTNHSGILLSDKTINTELSRLLCIMEDSYHIIDEFRSPVDTALEVVEQGNLEYALRLGGYDLIERIQYVIVKESERFLEYLQYDLKFLIGSMD